MKATSSKANLLMEPFNIVTEISIEAIWSMGRKVGPMQSLNLRTGIALLGSLMKMSLVKEYMKQKMVLATKGFSKMERSMEKGT